MLSGWRVQMANVLRCVDVPYPVWACPRGGMDGHLLTLASFDGLPTVGHRDRDGQATHLYLSILYVCHITLQRGRHGKEAKEPDFQVGIPVFLKRLGF